MARLLRACRTCRQQQSGIWFLRYQTLQILLLQALLVSPVELFTKDATIIVNSVFLTRSFVVSQNSMPLSIQVPRQPEDLETTSATVTAVTESDLPYSNESLCLNISTQSVVRTTSDIDDPDAHAVNNNFSRVPLFDDKGKPEETELEFMEIKPQRGEDATRPSCRNDSSTKEASPAHIDSEHTLRQRADVVTCASTAERDQLFVRFSTKYDKVSEELPSGAAPNRSRYNLKVNGFLSLNSSKSSGPNRLATKIPPFDITTIKTSGSERLGADLSFSRGKDITSTIQNGTNAENLSSKEKNSFEKMITHLFFSDLRNMGSSERVAAGSSSSWPPKNALSCEQRCGEDTNYPCSCDEKCLVYKTCCEDLAETCPGLYNLALAKFGHLLPASVHCDIISAVLLVQSCPPKTENVQSFKEDHKAMKTSSPSTISYDQNTSEDEHGKVYSLLEILSNAPFTDYDTGIIYANISIYKCNQESNDPISNQTLGSQVMSWTTQIGANNIDFHRELNDIQEELDLSTYSYVPPKSHPTSAGTLCYSNWTLSCISQLSRELNVSQLTCDTGVNEFYSLRKYLRSLSKTGQRYAHLICALCLSDAQRLSVLSHRYYLSGLKILMSLSEASGKVEYSVHKELVSSRQPIPWLLWTCNISGQSTHQAGRLCQAQHCDQLYLITSDGDCRKAVEAELSVQEQILLNGRKCRIEPTAFAEVSKCYLEKFYKLKATTKPFRTYRTDTKPWEENLTGIKTKISLTSIRMEMYFDSKNFETEYAGLRRYFYKIETAILVFAQRYCSMQDEWKEANGIPFQDDSQLVLNEPGDVQTTQNGNISFITGTGLDSKETLESSHFRLCLQLSPFDLNLSDAIQCDYFSGHYTSKPDVDMNDLLAKVNGLKCFKDEDTIYQSTSAKLFSPLLEFLITVTVVILWL
ncbi:hypothetical protein RRG08_021358 [Elysia crispata]|uniref:SMB domain-containing protein n=1 Tax=Elysia crispata TaxID=231223 RepID=A0AAE1CWM2_9GAST|nr:hypothetical protein RRG08_021358 [Elysia crispata]